VALELLGCVWSRTTFSIPSEPSYATSGRSLENRSSDLNNGRDISSKLHACNTAFTDLLQLISRLRKHIVHLIDAFSADIVQIGVHREIGIRHCVVQRFSSSALELKRSTGVEIGSSNRTLADRIAIVRATIPQGSERVIPEASAKGLRSFPVRPLHPGRGLTPMIGRSP
jgi:hypothetical protein